jgi:hypothetical protein
MLMVGEFRDRLAQINKRFINPLILSFAGRPGVPVGIVQHIGRRTGNRYMTPTLVGPTRYAFYIPLPYGRSTDWSLNLQEEGGGLFVTGGEAYRVIEPQVVEAKAAAGAYPGWARALLSLFGATHYLRVQRASSSPEPDTVYQRITADYPMATGLGMIAGLFLLLMGLAWIVWKLLTLHRD